jgi:hypothetical protein
MNPEISEAMQEDNGGSVEAKSLDQAIDDLKI